MNQPRLFVAIASFCDPECAVTVADLFAKAAHPERISVGICWQYDPAAFPPTCPVPSAYAPQIRQCSYHYTASEGAGWARAHAHELLDGEDYILQIDSHMRFAPGWDEGLMESFAACPHERVILTACCPNYEQGILMLKDDAMFRIAAIQLSEDNSPQLVHLAGVRMKQLPKAPLLSAGLIFNFVAAPAQAFAEAPIDPHLFFKGSETTQAARFFTRGWDLYQPNRVLAYHKWNVVEQAYKSLADTRSHRSRERVLHLMGFEAAKDPAALTEIDRYGMGNTRSVEEFWQRYDIDWPAGRLSDRAYKGKWDKVFL